MNQFERIKGMTIDGMIDFLDKCTDGISINKCKQICKPTICDGEHCREGLRAWLESEYVEPLKACPFCGSDDAEVYVWDSFVVICPDCGSQTGKADTRETAIEHWNERWSE